MKAAPTEIVKAALYLRERGEWSMSRRLASGRSSGALTKSTGPSLLPALIQQMLNRARDLVMTIGGFAIFSTSGNAAANG